VAPRASGTPREDRVRSPAAGHPPYRTPIKLVKSRRLTMINAVLTPDKLT